MFGIKKTTIDKGKAGEDIAAAFLNARGYDIVERNHRNRMGEIDLILKRKGVLIFVEVKTRTSTAYGLPQEAVTGIKQEKIRKTALAYMQDNGLEDAEIRFDVVAIMLENGSGSRIQHIPGAF
jgi:putative endonuclease